MKLSQRTLRAMRARWQADLDRLEATYSHVADQMQDHHDAEHETVRNLAAAIAWIDGLITRVIEPDEASK